MSAKRRGPSRCSVGALRSVGVDFFDIYTGAMRCMECGYGWWINNPGQGHRLPKGYWHCPQGCNVPEDE
jgi:hypothetical protein